MTMTIPTAAQESLAHRLDASPVRRRFADHDFFRRVAGDPLSREQVAVFLGQWWHPLHYFPTFLARCVAVLPDIASKSAISRILSQEAGGGQVELAHEVIYADTMEGAGFDRAQVTGTAPFAETQALVEGYERAGADRYSALGFIFATEVTDLMMVSGIGTAVTRATGATNLEWVNIHIEQEPDHVDEANQTMLTAFSPEEETRILERAEEMWRLWTGFFDRLQQEIWGVAPGSAPAAPAELARA